MSMQAHIKCGWTNKESSEQSECREHAGAYGGGCKTKIKQVTGGAVSMQAVYSGGGGEGGEGLNAVSMQAAYSGGGGGVKG